MNQLSEHEFQQLIDGATYLGNALDGTYHPDGAIPPPRWWELWRQGKRALCYLGCWLTALGT